MTTATMTMRRNQNLYRQKAEFKLGPVSSGFVLIAITAVLALLYLNAVTKTAVFGYELTQVQQARNKAVSVNQELEIEAARLTSIQQIQKSDAVAKMVSTTQVSYVK